MLYISWNYYFWFYSSFHFHIPCGQRLVISRWISLRSGEPLALVNPNSSLKWLLRIGMRDTWIYQSRYKEPNKLGIKHVSWYSLFSFSPFPFLRKNRNASRIIVHPFDSNKWLSIQVSIIYTAKEYECKNSSVLCTWFIPLVTKKNVATEESSYITRRWSMIHAKNQNSRQTSYII